MEKLSAGISERFGEKIIILVRWSELRLVVVEIRKGSRTRITESSAMARSEFGSVNKISEGGAIVKVAAFEIPSGLATVTETAPVDAISEREIAAVSCLAWMNVVGRSAPFQRTIEPSRKLSPLTVKLKALFPASTLAGWSAVMIGRGWVILKVAPFEVLPGRDTVTRAVPGAAISADEMAAVSCVDETTVVSWSTLFQRTIELGSKFVPFTVKLKASPPASTLEGWSAVMTWGALIVKVALLEVPPGPDTVTRAIPAAVISADEMVANSCVDEINDVGLSTLFQRTIELLPKFAPFTVKVKEPLPDSVLSGRRPVTVGNSTLLITVKLSTIRPLISLK